MVDEVPVEELDSALRHLAIALCEPRRHNDVAWWMCANHPRFLLNHPNLKFESIKDMAAQAGTPPTGDNWDQWFERVRKLK